jgi:hypothetical protein
MSVWIDFFSEFPVVVGVFNIVCEIGTVYLLWLGLKAIIDLVY